MYVERLAGAQACDTHVKDHNGRVDHHKLIIPLQPVSADGACLPWCFQSLVRNVDHRIWEKMPPGRRTLLFATELDAGHAVAASCRTRARCVDT